MNEHASYLRDIMPSDLLIDASYQRTLRPDEVKDIIKDFNMDVFNFPKVSHRADGSYYIFDGQHSVVGHKKVRGENTPIKCRVYEGLTYGEEVELFMTQNGHSRSLKTKDIVKADLNIKDSDSSEMVKAAKTAGVTISLDRIDKLNNTNAVAATRYAWKLLGKDNFINILSVIKDTWDGEIGSFSAGMIKGLARVYYTFGNKIKNKDMVTALKRHRPDWYAREAADRKGSLETKFAKIIVDTYNYKRTTYRLNW